MKKLICGICLVLFFAGNLYAVDTDDIKSKKLAQAEISWDGSPLPDYPEGKPEITILRIQIAPGAELPRHKHPVINAGVLIKGELTVITDENRVLHLKAGDAIIEVVDKWHYGKNEGSEPAEIIVFYAGTKDTAITVKE